MKALKISLIVVGVLALLVAGGYLYASSGIKAEPGYAKIKATPLDEQRAALSVSIGPGGVKPLRWIAEQIAEHSEHGDQVPERLLESLADELQGIQFKIYDTHGKRELFDSAISETAAALKQKQWQTLMSMRDKDEQIMVLQYLDNAHIAGLSIMASTQDTAFFLNLVGPFDIDALAAEIENL